MLYNILFPSLTPPPLSRGGFFSPPMFFQTGLQNIPPPQENHSATKKEETMPTPSKKFGPHWANRMVSVFPPPPPSLPFNLTHPCNPSFNWPPNLLKHVRALLNGQGGFQTKSVKTARPVANTLLRKKMQITETKSASKIIPNFPSVGKPLRKILRFFLPWKKRENR